MAELENHEEEVKKSKNIWFSLLFVLIAVLCVWTITSLNKSFSFANFIDFIKNAQLIWIIIAIICLILYIIFEGMAVNTISRSFGYKTKFKNGFFYSSADLYFSAITPSATGGQPASAYFMIKDGMNAAAVTAILLFNLLTYTMALFIVSFITFLFSIPIFLKFSMISKIFIVVGFFVEILLITIFSCLLFKSKLLYSICKGTLKILAKIHLVSKPEEKIAKLEETMNKYHEYAKMLKTRKEVMLKALGYNVLQRVCLFLVTVFVFLGAYGISNVTIGNVLSVWSIQCMVTIGANFIPIPGAMGISDYLLLDGFSRLLNRAEASNLELLTRFLSFYSCAIICGIAVLIKFCLIKKRSKK